MTLEQRIVINNLRVVDACPDALFGKRGGEVISSNSKIISYAECVLMPDMGTAVNFFWANDALDVAKLKAIESRIRLP